ncbi:hypothetical protein AAHE18_12G056900 [Arachis hypogaea]
MFIFLVFILDFGCDLEFFICVSLSLRDATKLQVEEGFNCCMSHDQGNNTVFYIFKLEK